jgi:hypothetical protein
MSPRSLLRAAAVAAVLAGAAAPALAADPAIDARVREAQGRLGAGQTDETAILTGSGDLVLLAPTQLFTVRADAAGEWTSNAQLAPSGGRDDFVMTGVGSITAATRIAGRYGVHASGSILAVRYDRDDSLDYSALTGDIGADVAWRTSAGRLVLAGGYAPALIYDDSFGDRQLTQHRLYAAAQLTTPLPAGARQRYAAALVTTLAADRTWADPSDYDNWSWSIDESLVLAVSRDIQFSLGAGYYQRDYDDYFEGFLGVHRRDHGWRASAAASFAINEHLAFNVRYTHVDNRSTSDVNPYRVDNGGVSVSLSQRF